MPDVAINLTPDQLKKIRDDWEVRSEMLTDSEVNAIAQKLDKVVNLPFIGEEKELIVLAKITKWVDKQLYRLLPNEYYELIRDASNGISEEEAKRIEKRLTPLINNAVNVPVLTEKQEGIVIGFILHLIITAMVKGFKLEEKPLGS